MKTRLTLPLKFGDHVSAWLGGGQGMGQTSSIGTRALSKASWHILPLLGLGYLFSYLDRINVAFWDGHAASMRRDQIACCDNWSTWPASSNTHPNYKNVWDLSGL